MRKRPITRDEVRVDHYEVRTLPGDSFHRDTGQPVARLWQPLLDSLRQQEHEWWESGPATNPELWGEFGSRASGWSPQTDKPPAASVAVGSTTIIATGVSGARTHARGRRGLPAPWRRPRQDRKRAPKSALAADARPAASQ